MGKAELIWYADTASGYPLSIFTARDMGNDETARIQQIRVTAPAFETAESIRVGATLADIRNHYRVTAVETYDQGGEKIGRASCRERVCQYVWISVVAGQ